ncbi:hypothetical protein N7G274_010488 [Stereocaulon virgatum]|uniref:Uncharacterized protein n=1 Tax=Stereocaulon virgatum TaxID=373712 RepID=A0ABR3ZTG0_9LECA
MNGDQDHGTENTTFLRDRLIAFTTTSLPSLINSQLRASRSPFMGLGASTDETPKLRTDPTTKVEDNNDQFPDWTAVTGDSTSALWTARRPGGANDVQSPRLTYEHDEK